MQFIYCDAQATLHTLPLTKPQQAIADIDVHWLGLGHQTLPRRVHAMACFEAIVSQVPEDHQFTFRTWYDMVTQQTHCVWVTVPKNLLNDLPAQPIQAKSLLFILSRFFPPAYRHQSVWVVVDLPGCEMVAGYVRGICVCYKKLPENTPIDLSYQWLHLQQTHPQWAFDYLVHIGSKEKVDWQGSGLLSVVLVPQASPLHNRMMLYGLS